MFPTPRRARPRHRLPSCRLTVEGLESRQTPTTLTVLSPGDSGPGSLRQAIADANTLAGDDRIVFDPGVSGAITLLSALPELSSNIDIEGPGAGVLTVQRSAAAGTPAFRILSVPQGATVTVAGLTVANGLALDQGGAILNLGTLTVRDSTFDGNSVSSESENVFAGALASGGALANGSGGVLSVSHSTFRDNSVTAAAEGYFSAGASAAGGAIANSRLGRVTVTDCTFDHNWASATSTAPRSSGATASGGAVANSNASEGSGGTMTVSDSTFTTNSASASTTATAPQDSIHWSRSAAAEGGAVANGAGGELIVSGSTFGSNAAVATGHGPAPTASYLGGNSIAATGGAVDNQGALTVSNSTFERNAASVTSNNPPGLPRDGPAGGAIASAAPFQLSVSSCTLANNTVTGPEATGGGIASRTMPVAIHNTIVALNSGDVSGPFLSLGYNLIGDASAATGFPGPGDQVGTAARPLDPLLGPLQDNGGPAPTMALLPASPAIDAGDPADFPPTDQRGVVRPQDGDSDRTARADVGAFEAAPGTTPGQPANVRFVAQLYRDLLQREADPAGLAAWTAQLDQGVPTSQVVLGIMTDPGNEYRRLEVEGIYQTYLGRDAGPDGLAAGVHFLAAGGTTEQLAAVVAGSPEFYQLAGGTDDGFLDRLYASALDRVVDPDGRASFTQGLAAGLPRADAAAVVLNSEEHRFALVAGWYATYLDRPPDPAGQQAWASVLGAGLSDEAALAAFLSEPTVGEYLNKTAPAPAGVNR
jgi:hypothetical protein